MKIINATDEVLLIYVGKDVGVSFEGEDVVQLKPKQEIKLPDLQEHVYVIGKDKDIIVKPKDNHISS